MRYRLQLSANTQWMRDRGLDPLFKDLGEDTFTGDQAVESLLAAFPGIPEDQTWRNFQDLVHNDYVKAVS